MQVPAADTPECALYGGFLKEAYCGSALKGDAAAQKACHDVLWGVFGQVGCNHDAGYPANLVIASKTEVACPKALEDKAF